MQYLFMGLMAAGIVAADQVTKYLTVQNIPLFGNIPALKGVFHFTYVQNTGAAFSSFEGMQWLFALVFALFTAGVIFEFITCGCILLLVHLVFFNKGFWKDEKK